MKPAANQKKTSPKLKASIKSKTSPRNIKTSSILGFLALLVLLVVPLVYYWANPRLFTPSKIDAWIASLGVFGPLVVVFAQVIASIIAPIPNSLISIAAGRVYGGFLGGLYSYIGGLLGAAATFMIARLLGHEFVHRFVEANDLESVDRYLSKHGIWAIFLGRIVPFLSFDAISYAAGLTEMSFWPFMAASAFGSAPGIFAYAYFGEYSAGLSPAVLLALVALCAALFLLVSKYISSRKKPKQ